jgi:hypothetical protein
MVFVGNEWYEEDWLGWHRLIHRSINFLHTVRTVHTVNEKNMNVYVFMFFEWGS